MQHLYLKIDSAKRVNYATTTPAQFLVPLQQAIEGCYRLKQVAVPITAFNVSSENGTIPFFENGSAKTCVLTPGYYTAKDLIDALAAGLTTASGGFATYTAERSDIPHRLTITSTQLFQLQFGSRSTKNAAEVLGFVPIDTAFGLTQTASNGINLATVRNYNIIVNNETSLIDSTGRGCSFLVPLFGNANSMCLYEPTLHFPQHLTFNKPTSLLGISVVDDDGAVLGLSSDWHFILEKC